MPAVHHQKDCKRNQRIFFYKIECIGFLSEEIDKGMIIALVGEKGCLITCLLKGRDDSF